MHVSNRGFQRAGLSTVAAAGVQLDESQLAALGIPDGRCAALLGAPGSGKTTVVVELVRERILERGYEPGDVLVLAAQRASATALRDRLALRVGVPTNGPLARTVNSLAFQIVRSADADGPVLLTGAEQDQIIADLLTGHLEDGSGPTWPGQLGPEVRSLRGFRTELRDLIARCSEYGVQPASLASLGRRSERPEWVAAADFIAEYSLVVDSFRARSFDSTELVQEAAAILRDAPVGTAGAGLIGPLAALRLIVVDDAQELTRSSLTLLAEFARRGVAVIAVGDPDISTGAFRGAHPDAIGRLGEYLGIGPVPVHTLDTVHRHGAGIRSVVSTVTGRIGTAAAGTQRAAATTDADAGSAGSAAGAGAHSIVCSSPAHQLDVIARTLRERHVFDGVPWAHMAVIVRGGSQVQPLARGLAALEVPTRVTTAGSALRDEPVVAAFVLALEVALSRRPLDAVAAMSLLGGPIGGLDPIALRRLRAALRREELAAGGIRPADDLIVEAIGTPGALESIDTAVARRAGRVADSIRAAADEAAAGATIEELLWGLWQRSGLERLWSTQADETGIAADEANRHLDAVVALFAAAQRYVEREPLGSAGLFLDELIGRDVAEDTLAPRAVADSVTVSTSNGVLGREFGIVVVAGVQENVWPDMRVRGSLLGANDLVDTLGQREGGDPRTAVLHDELRLFAQAASRARDELVVTSVRDEDLAPSAFLSLLPRPVEPAMERHPFSLRGMVARLRRIMTSEADAHRRSLAAAELARLAAAGVPGADPREWYGLAGPSTLEPLRTEGDDPVRVSPSRMEAFETCELHWLIDRLGGSTKNTASSLGSIIHAVAERAGAAPDADLGPDALLADVESRWAELPFESEWQSGVEHAKAADLTSRLSAYLREFRASGGELLAAEGGFELPLGDAVLRGTIDRVELRDGEVFIIDLKTGKSDPTTDAAVAEHAQLGAYQLAHADGAIPDLPALPLGGARLVIVSSGSGAGRNRKDWKQPTQAPLSTEELAAFRERVREDAARMGGATFIAQIGSHCFDPFGFGNCRPHVIGQVSA